MPTNLPPEAADAERRYRAATTPEEKIASLEELLGLIPKHKGTDKLRADYRKRLSKLKAAAQKRKGAGKRESPYSIDREGAGQVVVIGPANVGKSSLVRALTNANPEVSQAPYTTWKPTPGMMPVEDIQIQLVDTPALNRDYVEPELLNLIRRVDLVLLVVDLQTYPLQQLEEALNLLQEHRIVPLHCKEHLADQQRLAFVPTLILANKCDDEEMEEVFDIFCELLEEECPLLPVSALTGHNLDKLKQTVFEKIGVIRIYSKAPGKPPDLDAPFVLKRGSTVVEFAEKVHRDFYEKLKAARVWGSATFDGQRVSRDHVLADGDIVELQI